MDTATALRSFEERLPRAGLPGEARAAFARMYGAYRSGDSGKVDWAGVSAPAPGDLVPFEQAAGPGAVEAGRRRLGELAWIVLNGGLGTSMEMDRAKSLVPVRGKLTFLDLVVRHVLGLRARWKVGLPLLFMNSFATRDDTLSALEPYDLARQGVPLDFCQHQFPRIREDDGLPFGDPEERDAWAPPGHGNLYLALATSGVLDVLLKRGVRWAFVSNADNLGASPHPGILGYLAEQGLEFAMEVTPKSAADIKGGTLVRRRGRLELLEIAQVPDGHLADFQNTAAFPAFNTNNLWIDLAALGRRLAREPLDLPLIVNRKVAGGTRVVQLETAMGAAIGAFSRGVGLLVPRQRFAPVKTTDDLLVRRSDAFVPGEESPLMPNPDRDPGLGPLVVRLDPAYYRSVPGLDLRIPEPPSLVGAVSLELDGDVRFGRGVTVRGAVRVAAPEGRPLRVEDGALLSG
ncbi:MAG: UTP--glucose-1-phosphate uridylyltransferase [Deferrisomatales bacterium]